MTIPTITAAEPESRKVVAYEIHERKLDQRGIYRDVKIASFNDMKEVETFLKLHEEKWRCGWFAVKPVY